MKFPENLHYTEHDEWLLIDDDGLVVIGITDFAQDALGELVHVELPSTGDTIQAGDAVCEVESVKAVAEVYCPVSGEIVAVNEALEDEAEQINADPYGAWLVKVRPTQTLALEGLLDVNAYRAKVEGGAA